MNVFPIQVTEDAVLIPHHYLHDAQEFEIEIVEGYVVVRPKVNGKSAAQNWLQHLAGVATTDDPTASGRVDEILAEEMGRHQDEIGMSE